jgi:hypothetical protein
MRTRTAFLLAAVTVLVLAADVSPSAALSEQQAAIQSVPGQMLVVPRSDALITDLPVRVAVRVPSRTTRLRVLVGKRDVTTRFRSAGGSLRVADLGSGDGLHYGANHLIVLAERRGGSPVLDARSFVLAHLDAGLARVRIRPGPVTSVDVSVAAPNLTAQDFRPSGGFQRRLAVIRRNRTVRLWLNGRQVTRALDSSQRTRWTASLSATHGTRWTASLSATHGLRYGVNRLRVMVVEPDTGRYALFNRRFVVPRAHDLAAAGWDIATRVGESVRLNGSGSVTANGGRPRYSWRILSKPTGSHASLRGPGAERPSLTPDRPGTYVVGLTVTAGTIAFTAAQASASSTDTVAVTAAPSPLLVPFKGDTFKDGHRGIQVGNTFYASPSPDESKMQWLTLDRRTLTPTKTGNTWLDGTGSGAHGISALTDALSKQGTNQLVILSFPGLDDLAPPVKPDQIDAFNQAMKMIGVGPIDKDILKDVNKLVILGVPFAGDGSGWYTHGAGSADALTGWLMPDAVKDGDNFRFRFQPERPTFDTSSSSTSTTNTMTMRDQHADATLPPGATGGFQLVMLDPIDFTPTNARAVFATNGVADPARALTAMAKFLNDNAWLRFDVAVQSIGHVKRPAPPSDPYAPDVGGSAWNKVASALAGYGANPDTFNRLDGSYAFLGGSRLERSEVAQSSSVIVTNPTTTPQTRESGTLSGRMSMRAEGYWVPTLADASGSFKSSLYDIAFHSPTPWPYTAGGALPQQKGCLPPGNNTAAYAAALSYIAPAIHVPGDASHPDLRAAYVTRAQGTWSDQKTDLARVQFESGHGFGEAEFCNLKAELQREFDWLDRTKEVFDSYDKALGSSGNLELADLQKIGEEIRTAVAPDNSAEIGWSVGGFVGNMVSAGILAVFPEATPALAAWEAFVTVYEFVRELVSGADGAPVGDQVATKVSDLSQKVAEQLFDTASALVRLRQVIISDYGRLRALGSLIEGGGLNIDPSTMADSIRTGAKAFFSSELMPVAYDTWYLSLTIFNTEPTTDNCYIIGYGHSFRDAPATAQLQFDADFDGAQGRPSLLALGKHTWSARQDAYPPKEITDPMFRATSQKGYGMYLPDFVWSRYTEPYHTHTVNCYH